MSNYIVKYSKEIWSNKMQGICEYQVMTDNSIFVNIYDADGDERLEYVGKSNSETNALKKINAYHLQNLD